MQGNNEVLMPVDEQRIKTLETELAALKKELELCNDARRQVLKRHEGGIGQFRGWVPGCSGLEQDVANVSSELGRARRGEPSSPNFKLPSSDPSKPPPYLSPESEKLYDQIKNRMGVGGQLPYWFAGAVTETSVPALLKGTINHEVTEFLKDNGANLNDAERSYWERVQVRTGPPYTDAP